MNKNIAMLIVAVLLFAMALIAVNQFMSGEPDPMTASGVATGPEVTGQVDGQGLPPMTGNGTVSSPEVASGGLMPLDNGTLRELPPATVAGGEGQLAGIQPGEEDGPMVEQHNVTPAPYKAPAHTPAKAAVSEPQKASSKAAKTAPAKTEQGKTEQAKPAAKAATAKVEPSKAAASPKAEPAKTASKAEAKPAEQKAAKPAGTHGAKASIKFAGSTAILHLEGDAAMQYKTFVLKEPDRMVVDLNGAWDVKTTAVPSNRVIKTVRVGKPGEKTRIVLDLSKSPESHEVVKVNANTIEVRVK